MKDIAFGNRLNLLRKKKQLIQVDAARLIGVSYKSLQDHEGGRWPNKNNLQKYIDFYRCDRNWLLTGLGEAYINKDMDVAGAHQVAEHAADYAGGHSSDPFADAVSGLKEIFDSRDPILIPALEANIRAFRISARREKQINDQATEIKALRSECEGLKKRLAALEDKYKLIAPQPQPDEAAA